jgi:hypothetical protein
LALQGSAKVPILANSAGLATAFARNMTAQEFLIIGTSLSWCSNVPPPWRAHAGGGAAYNIKADFMHRSKLRARIIMTVNSRN